MSVAKQDYLENLMAELICKDNLPLTILQRSKGPSVPHVEKAKRLSSKEKVKLRRENQTAEEHQIAKTHDNNEHNNSRQHEKDVSNVNNAGKHL
jgi:hypothetical protein